MANATSPHLQNLLDRQNELSGYNKFVKNLPAEKTPEERFNQADPMRLQRNINTLDQRQERQLEEYRQRVNMRQFHMERSYQRVRSRV